ncbi:MULTISPECIES: ATP-binding cassette domain-containing protein [Streptomyces]|uniref:UvrABC system protein A n=1 Tax=Streptomyces tsukubensis (strain DSM 42081 / NBRC 108919 / NRRL 18488 / 9993) TaxID=1114943 RepID=I2N9I0_STRT9|nr:MULTISPECIES: excinuclease ABC subunit UvrA [Streptomyces]AZK97519.1 daunorubicin resistance protein DrrC [Streptomyces tsukubensis]EIF93677.1 excinuclease ABC subunit A [Streptomyces tsukubensis NRRL18488]MYS67983.1 ATP-binding cassette domain-containing protein [Streptomyces sp. SID5473]QKM66535.1 excinuclease ABC subunit UvrA [Streptomyces tsukubensis NRRL18488]TAI45123.1 excinuclease ABC subunit UvrA [Streptomyces tsukubensis]
MPEIRTPEFPAPETRTPASPGSGGGAIVITGARENNLRDVSLTLPKNKITVFTGVSGSGKSSVVFDTIAVESQRQLNETFSSFVRNRLPKYERPLADGMDELSVAIVVDQKPLGGNARSTVGTMTDIYSVLRVLFSRHSTPAAGPATAYSFNDPTGMCPVCDGLGRTVALDVERAVDWTKSLDEGALLLPGLSVGSWEWKLYAESGRFDTAKPLDAYTPEERELLLHGSGFSVRLELKTGSADMKFEGIVNRFTRLFLKRDTGTLSEKRREAADRFTVKRPCPECGGARLNAAARASRIDGLTITDWTRMEVADLIGVLRRIDDPVAAPVAAAAREKLERLVGIGLGYLSLDRETTTLSGGEGQRLKMVRHLGSSLTGLTFVFDEPSVGLHPRDVGRLNDLLVRLRDRGNTVLVVEHDPDVMAIADHIVDMGPGAGTEGGRVVYEGPFDGLRRADTLTGRCLRRRTPLKETFRTPTGRLAVTAADRHNLKGIDVGFPAGVLTAVTGVAGSGKSTLVSEVFTAAHPEAVVIDQGAITASVRSTPASYLGLMDSVRRIFARENGVDPGLFSFNSSGACRECSGRGVIQTDLAFMDPVTTVCRTCGGRRFQNHVLAHRVRGRSIVDVLGMTAAEASAFFEGEAQMLPRLAALDEVGLGYLALGQPLSTLSGGERQRLKLATQLHRTGSVYVLDEPTTGLHMADVGTLVTLLDRLVDAGNTVICVEHNTDVVKRADWVVDLGPDGGKHGGELVFEGTPAQLLAHPKSFTAEFLRRDPGIGQPPGRGGGGACPEGLPALPEGPPRP